MLGVDFAEYLSTALKVVFHFIFSPLGLIIIFGPVVLQNFVTRLKATIDKTQKSTVILSGGSGTPSSKSVSTTIRWWRRCGCGLPALRTCCLTGWDL
jgi:hypothetical protein